LLLCITIVAQNQTGGLDGVLFLCMYHQSMGNVNRQVSTYVFRAPTIRWIRTLMQKQLQSPEEEKVA